MEQTRPSYPSYLALSIFNLICCCCPLGIAAVICSLRVENAAGIGDMERASKASTSAKTLNIIGIICGIVLVIITVVLVLMMKHH